MILYTDKKYILSKVFKSRLGDIVYMKSILVAFVICRERVACKFVSRQINILALLREHFEGFEIGVWVVLEWSTINRQT